MTYQEMYDYGVRTGHIEASCDHPTFYQKNLNIFLLNRFTY